MFDLRYHVASLAAVFLALIIGILVGAGISGRGLLDEAERDKLEQQITNLQAELAAERRRTRAQEASEDYAESTAPAVLANRLAGKRFAVVFVGYFEDRIGSPVAETIDAGGGQVVRMRALTVPLPVEEIQAALAARRALSGYLGRAHLGDLGRDLARELVAGDETPLWDALADILVEERQGTSVRPADGVVVARTAAPRHPATARFLRGFYDGLAGSVTTVGVEDSAAELSAVQVFRSHGLSSVDNVDSPVGRVALAALLAGARPGHYGVKESAQAPLPTPIEPVSAPPGDG